MLIMSIIQIIEWYRASVASHCFKDHISCDPFYICAEWYTGSVLISAALHFHISDSHRVGENVSVFSTGPVLVTDILQHRIADSIPARLPRLRPILFIGILAG